MDLNRPYNPLQKIYYDPKAINGKYIRKAKWGGGRLTSTNQIQSINQIMVRMNAHLKHMQEQLDQHIALEDRHA